LELKIFHRTQRDLATAINSVIDKYWENEITEQQMIDTVKNLKINNPNKFIKDGKFTTIIRQQCGKRRLEVVQRIIDMEI
jgi:uncharacterized protein (TIGR04540 family)